MFVVVLLLWVPWTQCLHFVVTCVTSFPALIARHARILPCPLYLHVLHRTPGYEADRNSSPNYASINISIATLYTFNYVADGMQTSLIPRSGRGPGNEARVWPTSVYFLWSSAGIKMQQGFTQISQQCNALYNTKICSQVASWKLLSMTNTCIMRIYPTLRCSAIMLEYCSTGVSTVWSWFV